MSFICRVVIGYFDADFVCRTNIRGFAEDVHPYRPVAPDVVDRVQRICKELFGINVPLHECLIDNGVLCMESWVMEPAMYQVACVAHQAFGMSAVDVAHQCNVLENDWAWLDCGKLADDLRRQHPDWNESQVQTKAEETYRRFRCQCEFERKVQERIALFVQESLRTP